MNKRSLHYIHQQQQENLEETKSMLLKEIATSLIQIGVNTLGIEASKEDNLEFLKLYASLAKRKANKEVFETSLKAYTQKSNNAVLNITI